MDESIQLQKPRLDAVKRVWWDLEFPSCGLGIPIATNYDWMPRGGFGWIWIGLRLYEPFHLPKTTAGHNGAGWAGFGFAFMWSSQSKFKNYGWKPWGGFGGIEISLHMNSSCQLQNI